MTAVRKTPFALRRDSAGMLMSPREFDSIEDYDESYRYELIHGVLVVTEFPPPEIVAPNELLGYVLWRYQQEHRRGSTLDCTLPHHFVRTRSSRRIADRLIWTGLG